MSAFYVLSLSYPLWLYVRLIIVQVNDFIDDIKARFLSRIVVWLEENDISNRHIPTEVKWKAKSIFIVVLDAIFSFCRYDMRVDLDGRKFKGYPKSHPQQLMGFKKHFAIKTYSNWIYCFESEHAQTLWRHNIFFLVAVKIVLVSCGALCNYSLQT